jgi:hypothetical protein
VSDKDRGPGEGLDTDIGGGEHLTVNSTDNPSIPGCWYQTTTNDKGDKSSAVYDSHGNMPSGKGTGDNDKYK